MTEQSKTPLLRGNTKYCLLFLWNGGEQIRAIGLLKELNPEMPTKEAREFMENLAANYGRDKHARGS